MEIGKGPIVFTVRPREFLKAVKYLLACRSSGKGQLDLVDLNARGSEVELVTTSSSSAFPAEIKASAYARLPLLTFERIARAVRTLRMDSVVVTIKPGEIKFDKLLVTHPDIEICLMGARIADLPMDAPLPDVLGLLTRFRPEEISDSGLASQILSTQGQAATLIKRATEILKPLGIEREELTKFIFDLVAQKYGKRNEEK